MNTSNKFSLLFIPLMLLGMAFWGCERTPEFSEDYDIPWPLPTISGFSSNEADIETEITINGTNLDRVIEVIFAGNQRVSNDNLTKSANSVTVAVPRLAEIGTISVRTNLAKATESDASFRPIYPEAVVETWPEVLYPGQSTKIKGQNMDMITAVSVDGTRILLDGNAATPTEVSFSLEMVDLTPGTNVVLTLEARNGLAEASSPSIPVEEYVETNFFDAIEPIVLKDFEDGVDPYSTFSTAGITDESGINLSGISKGRGDKYLTIRAAVPSGQNWDGMGSIDLGEINLADFNDPHLTFMLNTNGKRGYFQVEMEQDGNGRGGHFVSSLNEDDDYTFPITNGWEWRSIRLADFSGNNGGWGDPIDPTGIIKLAFGVKQGNGGNFSEDFELNIDQVMITDGKRNASALVFDFEDGINIYDGSASSQVNGAVANFGGDNYLNVELVDNVGKWNWTGAIENLNSIDLGSMEFPYISFAINTGNAKGYIQVETFQNNTKWGIGQTAPDYYFETAGEWQIINLLLTPALFSNWGGDATEIDLAGTLDYLKIGFTTGNVENEKYEVNIDDVYISDGKVF